jgi:tRNA (cytidine/uridine-2'-O-)-methyltransferase
MAFHIVLVEPEIPGNTGNIARTCAATGTWLHLVRPLGFEISDRTLKRAGLDYWHAVEVRYYDSFSQLRQQYPDKRFFMATTKADKPHTAHSYRDEDFLVFGKETAGLPESILSEHKDTLLRIPMGSAIRSLNLANSAAVVLYEALRQTGFPGLN